MKPTYATFDRAAFREMCVQAVAACEFQGRKLVGREIYGYLVGRPTRAGFNIGRVPLAPYVVGIKDGIYYADEDQARFDLAVASAFRGRSEVVGHWHTHVYYGRCVDALGPQINDVDERTTPDGLLEAVCAVYPTQQAPPRLSDTLLVGVVAGHVCALEVWLRRGQQFTACSVRVA